MPDAQQPTLGTLADVKAGGKAALARALADVEARPYAQDWAALLDEAFANPRGHTLGLTGPPGVGKSTLTAALIRAWRQRGQTVGVIAVDPSSARTGGALLGDRIRLNTDPEDDGVFVRSMAAGDRLGGLASATAPAMVLMRALYDIVVVETVGVGQSETGVEAVADTAAFCIQPAAGDALQFMKAGIMEVPDLFVVLKADLGPVAERARADVMGAVGLTPLAPDAWLPPVMIASAAQGRGLDTLLAAVARHRDWLHETGALDHRRRQQMRGWLEEDVRVRFGQAGIALVHDDIAAIDARPFAALSGLIGSLDVRRTDR